MKKEEKAKGEVEQYQRGERVKSGLSRLDKPKTLS